MFIYRGLQAVAKGTYWNPADGRRVIMRRQGVLPGDAGMRYLKMSPLGLLVVAPLFGATFVTFMPLLGIGVLLVLCLIPAIGSLGSVAVAGVRICCGMASRRMSVSWTPTRASFTGVTSRGAIYRYTLADKNRAVGSPVAARLDPFKNISVG